MFVLDSALERLSVSDETRQLQQFLLGSGNVFANNDFVQQNLRDIIFLDTSDRDMLGPVFPYARFIIRLWRSARIW